MSYDIHQTDKLSIFVDDMRRLGVAIAPPSINASLADFSVESAAGGLAVRYALGALKGVGEKAMEGLVAERESHGPFADLADFADRVDPRQLNRRQIEALAGAGAFDGLGEERPVVFGGAETLLAAAQGAAAERESGQGGLFGGDAEVATQLQFPPAESWSMAERMAREKDAFGFYFSAHPVQQYETVMRARGVRSYGEYCAGCLVTSGTRTPGLMAGLVEFARWRTSQRGNRFLTVGLSDRSGQFQASCFDEHAAKLLEALAEQGACAVLGVELDLPEGEETPRVAVRSAQPLAEVAAASRLERDCLRREDRGAAS
jgi:DNA polymerase-3 subunit alpha